MKIKLVRYAFREHEIGDVVDFGEEKNKSMVSLQRAVWYDPDKVKKPDPVEEIVKDVVEKVEEAVTEKKVVSKKKVSTKKKEFLKNELRDKITEKKDGEKLGFWDKLR